MHALLIEEENLFRGRKPGVKRQGYLALQQRY